MKPRSKIKRSTLTVLLAVGIFLAGLACWDLTRPALPQINTEQLLRAIQRYGNDHAKAGTPLPRQISGRDLIREGYLPSDAFAAFEGCEVLISLSPDQDYLVAIRHPGGSEERCLVDGTITVVR